MFTNLTAKASPAEARGPKADCKPEIEVFFDGACPLCRREINLLKWLDKDQRIGFIDIAAADFEAAPLGISYEKLMHEIHGRLADGSIITGVEVFRRLYAAVGFGPLVAVTRWPGISQVMDLGYAIFARNRLRMTGRCQNGVCDIHSRDEFSG